MAKKIDPRGIDHPQHYNVGQYEVVDVCEGWGLDKDAYLFNVVKYVARAEHKGSQIKDLEKARWYLDRKIENLKKAEAAEAKTRTRKPVTKRK